MYQEIKVAEVERLMKEKQGTNIIDVREHDEVAQGKIPGAYHIPLGELEQRLPEIDADKEHIIVCRSGGRSGRASEFLASRGYKVKNMTGGMLEWNGKTEV